MDRLSRLGLNQNEQDAVTPGLTAEHIASAFAKHIFRGTGDAGDGGAPEMNNRST
jgi:hypothetical protein